MGWVPVRQNKSGINNSLDTDLFKSKKTIDLGIKDEVNLFPKQVITSRSYFVDDKKKPYNDRSIFNVKPCG